MTAPLTEIRAGDIGADPQEIEFEPFNTPAVPEPIATPVTTPEPVLVPA